MKITEIDEILSIPRLISTFISFQLGLFSVSLYKVRMVYSRVGSGLIFFGPDQRPSELDPTRLDPTLNFLDIYDPRDTLEKQKNLENFILKNVLDHC